MKDEFFDRHQAIRLRLAGQPIEHICQAVGRSRVWFHTWWRRYQALGVTGLFDLTRATHQPPRLSPDLERTILNIRRRLESQIHPQTRYSLIGASAILAELKALHIRPLPCERTIERVLARNGLTMPRLRLARYVAPQPYPAPTAEVSNQLHQLDLVGPIYLKGQRQRYYIFVCRDTFDGAICLQLGRSRQMEAVLAFLGECWKHLGRPQQIQFDNAREFLGWGPAARYLSRVIRLCLRFGVEPIFIPPARPQHNGAVEWFNGWFQPRLLQRHYNRVSALRRELQRLQETVNTQHAQRRLGGRTPAQHTCPNRRCGSAPAEAAKAARTVRSSAHALADRSGTGDLHPAGHALRQHPSAQPVLQDRQAAQGPVRQGGARHAARPHHRLRPGAYLQALALPIRDQVTDIHASTSVGCHRRSCKGCAVGSKRHSCVSDALSART